MSPPYSGRRPVAMGCSTQDWRTFRNFRARFRPFGSGAAPGRAHLVEPANRGSRLTGTRGCMGPGGTARPMSPSLNGGGG